MAAIVIALANGKGGVGKSTVALNIQYAISTMRDSDCKPMNLNALLVDADDQQTSTKTCNARAKLGGMKIKGVYQPFEPIEHIFKDQDVESYVKMVNERHDFIVIDTKGAESDTSREVTTFANILLIPLSPYGFDKQALADTLKIVKKGQRFNPDMLVMVVFNKVDKKATAKNREGREEVNAIINEIFAVNGKTAADNNVFICAAELSYKPTFYSEMTKGYNVFEAARGVSLDPKTEYDKLLQEIQTRYAEINNVQEAA